MAVWFAQKSGNISANDVFFDAPSGGTAKDVSVESDGTIILSANSYTIAIDEDVTALRLSTADEDAGGAGVAGGGFTVAGTRTITANALSGSTDCLTPSGSGYTLTLIGNYTGSQTTGNTAVFRCAVAITVNITGNMVGGGGNSASQTRFAVSASGGTINIVGNASSPETCPAINVASNFSAAVTLQGNIINTAGQAIAGTINYNPGINNYIEYPKPTSGTYKYGKTIPQASVLDGVDGDGVDPPATGNVVLPAVEDVEDGVFYGAASALEGTLVAGGGVIVIDD